MAYDIVIIGSGPAGLTAAIYAKRANLEVLVIEKEAFGGLITHSPKIENYPGYNSLSGLELADKFMDQAMNLGASFEFDNVIKVEKQDDIFKLTGENKEYEGKTIIIATGSKHRTLKLENEENLVGHGISYCAVCDGPFYSGQDVTIIGGGNSAMQEALLLSTYCKSVTMIQNLAFFTGEDALQEQIKNSENISVIFNKTVAKFVGENSLEGIVLKDALTNEETLFETKSVFVAIGQEANNQAFTNVASLDDNGFIITKEDCKCEIEGIYAAGDCRQKAIRQIVTASSDGSIAALQAIRYLKK